MINKDEVLFPQTHKRPREKAVVFVVVLINTQDNVCVEFHTVFTRQFHADRFRKGNDALNIRQIASSDA